MFFENLRRLRPQTSIFLAFTAMGVAAACAPADEPANTVPTPIGGTTGGGTTGGASPTGGTTGGGTTGGAATGGTTGGVGGTTGGTGATTGGVGGTTGGTGATTGGVGGTTGGVTDGGVPDGGAGGTTGGPTVVGNFPGKYMGCTSYGVAMGTGDAKTCTSWQCKITLGQLKTAYVMGAGKCANRPVEDICDNKIATDVGKCARDTKTANVLDTNAQLRPKVIACVRKVNTTEYSTTKLPDDCLNCFVDVADCAGDKCLFECLTADGPDCDACRLKNNCDQKVFTCGGLPNVF